MRMRKALSGLLALVLALTVLTIPAFALADDPEPELSVSDMKPEFSASDTEPELAASDPEPLTPEGNMALVDDIDGNAAEDKQFIVVQSRGGHYFYIIIDHASEGENIVHFLNQVDEVDLLSLIEQEEQALAVCSCTDKCHAGAVNTSCEICAVNMSECAGTKPEPEEPDTSSDEPDTPDESNVPEEPDTPEKKAGNPLMIAALVAVLGAGGVVAYLKFFRKKPRVKGSADLDDYDYGADDDPDDEPEDDGLDDESEDE